MAVFLNVEIKYNVFFVTKMIVVLYFVVHPINTFRHLLTIDTTTY